MTSNHKQAAQEPQVVEGESISLSRNVIGIALVEILTLSLATAFLAGFIFISQDRRFLGPAIACVVMVAVARVVRRFTKPSIVAGYDRIQLVVHNRVCWEIAYEDIEEIKLVTKGIRPALVPRYFLGIKLAAPELFDKSWPRISDVRKRNRKWTSYDICIPTRGLTEPAEAVLERILTCYHRFRMNSKSSDSSYH